MTSFVMHLRKFSGLCGLCQTFSLTEKKEKKTDKIFKDSVHGTIKLPAKLVQIIDTPQFQRLRNVKQLGSTYFVYPGASHNRFEHSIGTSHLAGEFVETLRAKQKELKITDEEVLCVKIAGLCHDLGHGPFSHMFDHLFMPRFPDTKTGRQHEERSCNMLEYLLKENHIDLADEKDGYDHERMLQTIKTMIRPSKMELCIRDRPIYRFSGNIGRYYASIDISEEECKDRRFLYQIVSNEENKFDVDKWDYFARDCHHLGMCSSFDHTRFIQSCRVLDVKEPKSKMICPDEKECKNVYEMFHTRSALHRRAYQHKVATAVDAMICDAMVLADEHILIGGWKMSEIIEHPDAFTRFDDGIFNRILYPQSDDTIPEEATKLLKRVLDRDLYRQVDSIKLPLKKNLAKEDEDKLKNLETDIKNHMEETNKKLKSHFQIAKASFDFGAGKSNPCEKMWFFSKKDINEPKRISLKEESWMLPETFKEFEIRVFSTDSSKDKDEEIKDAFEKWRKANKAFIDRVTGETKTLFSKMLVMCYQYLCRIKNKL